MIEKILIMLGAVFLGAMLGQFVWFIWNKIKSKYLDYQFKKYQEEIIEQHEICSKLKEADIGLSRPMTTHLGMALGTYNAMEDSVKVLHPAYFKGKKEKKEADFNSVLTHELVHRTGHTSRLNRELLAWSQAKNGMDMSKPHIIQMYNREELIAETGSFILCNFLSLPRKSNKEYADYLFMYLRTFRDEEMVKELEQAWEKAEEGVIHILKEMGEEARIPKLYPGTKRFYSKTFDDKVVPLISKNLKKVDNFDFKKAYDEYQEANSDVTKKQMSNGVNWTPSF